MHISFLAYQLGEYKIRKQAEMKIFKLIFNKHSTISHTVVALIFFQMLVGTVDLVNLACVQKYDGGSCKEFISGWNNTEYNEVRDDIIVKNNTLSRLKRNYVSKFTIDELLKLKVRKTISNDLDMDPEKSGLFIIV